MSRNVGSSALLLSLNNMAGLYIHIPFCKKRCIYCDFFSSTNCELSERYLKAMIRELDLRSSFFRSHTIDTLYLGGGTPSQLSIEQLAELFQAIEQYIDIQTIKECTIEANPDDLSTEYIQGLLTLPFNRLSLGVQSFQDHHLQFLNRRHTAQQAITAISSAQKAGFTNLSIDLMFGLPHQTIGEWESDIQTALSLGMQHISAYCLTYESGTQLHRKLENREVEEVDEETFQLFQNKLIEQLKEAGFHRYEVSNYAQQGYEAKHNSSYWQLIPYIGIGASAHSFDQTIRSWNVSNIIHYCSQLEENNYSPENEQLSDDDQHNEFILLALRTSAGISLHSFEDRFGTEAHSRLLSIAQKWIDSNHFQIVQHHLSCTSLGYNIMNSIITELMV